MAGDWSGDCVWHDFGPSVFAGFRFPAKCELLMDFAQFFLIPIADALAADLLKLGLVTAERKIKPDDPVRQALVVALGRAIRQYATSDGRLEAARPLQKKRGFLTDPTVVSELAKVLSRDGAPDTALIGQRWRAAMKAPPPGRDFTRESAALLEFFREEAIRVEPLRSIIVAGNTDEIVISLAQLAQDVAKICEMLTAIMDLPEGLGGIAESLLPGVRTYLYDQTSLIAEHTREFVGRRFVFSQIHDIIETRDRAYCHVIAHPGVGKTALLAQLVKEQSYVHHFNVRTSGVVSPRAFLGNICAQLIGKYNLGYEKMPERATQDAGYLAELLGEILARPDVRKIVIAVDALDEADTSALLPGMNPLYLPAVIPEGAIFVVTSRPDARGGPLQLRVDSEQVIIRVDHRSEANMVDIRDYLSRRLARPGIADYMKLHGLDDHGFVELLAERSEGNFMYLHHVLPEIEHGGFRDRDVRTLPLGLTQYYSDHLERMRGADEYAWFQYRLPVIAALSTWPVPLTVTQIAAMSGITETARVAAVLREWGAFLEPVTVEARGARQRAYRIYHASFQDFLREEMAADA